MAKRFLAPAIFASLLCGQALHVPPSHAAHSGSFPIVLDSPEEHAPSTLQWDMLFPPAIDVSAADITNGSAADAAGKKLTCSKTNAAAEVNGAAEYACILAGGRKPIGNGPIAVVQYRIKMDVGGAPIRIPIQKILGVTADLERVAMPNVDAIISTQ
jgi:hypothetical protein